MPAAAPSEQKEEGKIMKRIEFKSIPNPKQAEFFRSKTRYTAYGGARGGGKSWALRRKLITLCLRYSGIRCLLVRRTYAELKANHLFPLSDEYGELFTYSDTDKLLRFSNGSTISLGYCDAERDALRYQGQEYDIIAIDEATQLSEYQFSIFKACLRGVNAFPRRMYLTCNPGGVGHGWVKRLFVDRRYYDGEREDDYTFIPANVYDNPILTSADPDYVRSLETLPKKLRAAWLYGEWGIFEGQFFPEFVYSRHVCRAEEIPQRCITYFASADYGFDMFALLLCGIGSDGRVYVIRELCKKNLTLGEAGREAEAMLSGYPVRYLVLSPDMYNRRQDTGRSGIEIFSEGRRLPPLAPADDRRIQGWRCVREYLSGNERMPCIQICDRCEDLIRSLPLLLCDPVRAEDASDSPHEVTHSPEALRYALMSRAMYEEEHPEREFFKKKKNGLW